MDQEQIIIKKVRKRKKHGHHGGAWKVAYADFVTAMMAFFMVMWLIATLSIETRAAMADYFRSATIFKGVEAGGGKGVSIMKGNPVKLDADPGDLQGKGKDNTILALEISKLLETRLGDVKDNLMINATDEGVRIEMVDSENASMFEIGSPNLLVNGQDVLKVLAESFDKIPYSIAIEGHTDGYDYPSATYTNWELAADRANAARRELIKNGLEPERVVKVTSFADSELLNSEDPFDPNNRRVSILVQTRPGASVIGR